MLRKNIFKLFEERYNLNDFFINDKSKFQNQINIRERELMIQIRNKDLLGYQGQSKPLFKTTKIYSKNKEISINKEKISKYLI